MELFGVGGLVAYSSGVTIVAMIFV